MLDLGGLVGFTALHFAPTVLANGGKYIMVEQKHESKQTAVEVLVYAGLNDVYALSGNLATNMHTIEPACRADKIDFVLMRQNRSDYVKDLQALLSKGLLHAGSVIVADNTLSPGAPEYIQFIQSHPNFRCETMYVPLEYMPSVVDALEVATLISVPKWL